MMTIFKPGDVVFLKDTVRHAEFRNLRGTVKRIVKSRGEVQVLCDNGKMYGALPENLKKEAECQKEEERMPAGISRRRTPYERTRQSVYATGNKWAIENFHATHD